MWGKEAGEWVDVEHERIIPTGVGKRSITKFFHLQPPDHPHGCGEKPVRHGLDTVSGGSSPRVWGKEIAHPDKSIHVRIIPTGVGKSPAVEECNARRPDHPHGCGEKPLIYSLKRKQLGSSPRVWGKEYTVLISRLVFRIIPTGVGKSYGRRNFENAGTDHPHGCGEKCRMTLLILPWIGSSPRVWGKGFMS